MSVSPYSIIHAVLVARKSNKSLSIPIELSSEKNVENVNKIHALVDTGAGGKFINQNFAHRKGYPLKTLDKLLAVYNVDGTPNKKGTIRNSTELWMKVNRKKRREELLVTGLGSQKVILGFPWLEETNPDVNWRKGTLKWRTPELRDIGNLIANHPKRKKTKIPKVSIEEIPEPISTLATIPEWYPTGHVVLHESIIENLENSTKTLLHYINSYNTLEEQISAWLKDDSEE